jgi:hypothetical protein
MLPERGLTMEDLDACRDALEPLLNYRYLICAKLYRAVSARTDAEAERDRSRDARLVRNAGRDAAGTEPTDEERNPAPFNRPNRHHVRTGGDQTDERTDIARPQSVEATPGSKRSAFADLMPRPDTVDSHDETPDPDGSAATPDDPADSAAKGFLLDACQSADVARKAIHRPIDAYPAQQALNQLGRHPRGARPHRPSPPQGGGKLVTRSRADSPPERPMAPV